MTDAYTSLVPSLKRIRTSYGIKRFLTSIPGDPSGIPGTESPIAFG